MNENLAALKLVLDELKVSSDIRSLDDRKRVQKAVYLGQVSGVNLGYRFGWYIMGPYSPGLARDYFQLAEDVVAEAEYLTSSRLSRLATSALEPLRDALVVPGEIRKDVNQPEWLELLASYHYLINVSRQDRRTAEATLAERKPHVAPYTSLAIDALRQAGLLAP